MIYIGIDYSLTSPAMTYFDGKKFKFVSFFRLDDYKSFDECKHLKKFIRHKELSELKDIELIPYHRVIINKSDTYQTEQSKKMEDAKNIALLIQNKIHEITKLDKEVKIAIEGFSYASKGQSFIDLILYNSFLRCIIGEEFNMNNIIIVSPTQAKQLAGKGNFDKYKMINAFAESINYDNCDKEFVDYIKHFNELLKDNPKLSYKPLDDLSDSCFHCRWIIENT